MVIFTQEMTWMEGVKYLLPDLGNLGNTGKRKCASLAYFLIPFSPLNICNSLQTCGQANTDIWLSGPTLSFSGCRRLVSTFESSEFSNS